MESKMVIIRDVELHYPHLAEVHSPFGTAQWDVMVTTTPEDTKAELEAVGVKMKPHTCLLYTSPSPRDS